MSRRQSWRSIQTATFVEALWRCAGSRVTLIELATWYELPDAEQFVGEINRLADRLEAHLRDRWRAMMPPPD